MRRFFAAVLLLLWPCSAAAAPGALLVVGGGATGPEIVERAVQLAGGRNAIVAVLPEASGEADAGKSSVAMWLAAGVSEAAVVMFDDRAAAAAALRRATLIWMPGGDQNRFMKAIAGTGLAEVIRHRHRDGVAIGGTSAGAAVMADAMFTGDADLKSLTAGATVIAKGLGLWPAALIDQHFLKRQRDNRLISAVFDHPALVGIGIDESTAVLVRGDSFEVIGRSSVVVIDGRRAKIQPASAGTLISGTGLALAVLHAGQTYALK
jgi:cyanophycinase